MSSIAPLNPTHSSNQDASKLTPSPCSPANFGRDSRIEALYTRNVTETASDALNLIDASMSELPTGFNNHDNVFQTKTLRVENIVEAATCSAISNVEAPLGAVSSSSSKLLKPNPKNLLRLNFKDLKQAQLEEFEETKKIVSLREILKRFCNIEQLELVDISSEELLNLKDSIKGLKKLTEISISGANVEEVDFLGELNNLETISLSYCELLQRLPKFTSESKLTKLWVRRCYDLITLESFICPNLEMLGIGYCTRLRSVDLLGCPSIKHLKIEDCSSIFTLEGVKNCTFLEYLTLQSCFSLKSLKGVSSSFLSTLHISNCVNLVSCSGAVCPNLKNAFILDCPEITSIQDIFSQKLEWLTLGACPSLTSLEGLLLSPNFETLILNETGICDWEITDLMKEKKSLEVVGETDAGLWTQVAYGFRKLKMSFSKIYAKILQLFK